MVLPLSSIFSDVTLRGLGVLLFPYLHEGPPSFLFTFSRPFQFQNSPPGDLHTLTDDNLPFAFIWRM
jgi:hypothetical protein